MVLCFPMCSLEKLIPYDATSYPAKTVLVVKYVWEMFLYIYITVKKWISIWLISVFNIPVCFMNFHKKYNVWQYPRFLYQDYLFLGTTQGTNVMLKSSVNISTCQRPFLKKQTKLLQNPINGSKETLAHLSLQHYSQ